jgi:peptide/nickel transport system permease protein
MSHWNKLWRHSAVRLGCAVLAVLLLLALLAPWLGTFDPAAMDPTYISVAAGTRGEVTLPDGQTLAHVFWMGSDNFGRDIWSRVLYGTRVSLTVGLCTAVLAVTGGCLLGMLAGYFRPVDAVLMRLVDGMMAIPPCWWPSPWWPCWAPACPP